jgi:hypothetical protein
MDPKHHNRITSTFFFIWGGGGGWWLLFKSTMLMFMVVQFPGLKGLFPTGSSPMKILLRSKAVILLCR